MLILKTTIVVVKADYKGSKSNDASYVRGNIYNSDATISIASMTKSDLMIKK